jgi:membrane fusion protein, multidrug efflux system
MNTSRKTSIYLAAGVVVIVALWMLSGLGGSSVDFTTDTTAGRDGVLMRVRTEQIRAEEVVREVVVSARTEPNRVVRLKAETDGAVITLGVNRGSRVNEGGIVVGLDMRDRNARLVEADSLITQRQLEFEALENLRNQQFTTQVQKAEARARLDSAVAARERIVLEIANTSIVAPFDGIVQERNVEIGDFVRSGDTVIDLVDIDPLIIAGEINGKEVTELDVGGIGTAKLVDGTIIKGVIRYLAPVADENTRTFRIELEVANPDNIRAGLTAELKLDGARISAHDLSPALLTLADDGVVGIKTVSSNNTVEFYPVEIAGATNKGILVTGLPESVRVITVGQGFVTVGQQVEPVTFSALESNTANERVN